jgi:hypothetical protein
VVALPNYGNLIENCVKFVEIHTDGLSAPETLRAMPVVAYLLVGSTMPDSSRNRSQRKRDTLVLQVEGWASG